MSVLIMMNLLCTYYSHSLSSYTALQVEEAKHRDRADETSDLKKKIEEAKQTTVDDLTRGVVNYKFLGLDFEKAEDDRLK